MLGKRIHIDCEQCGKPAFSWLPSESAARSAPPSCGRRLPTLPPVVVAPQGSKELSNAIAGFMISPFFEMKMAVHDHRKQANRLCGGSHKVDNW
jgi:hypothetical protein